jgi:hypothetical protein
MFVDQVKGLIDGQLSLVSDYNIKYFTATHPENNENLLVFEIASPQLGTIYRKVYILKDKNVTAESEEIFMGTIIADFAVISIASLTKNVIRNKKKVKKIDLKDMAANPITDKPFSRGSIIHINMN